MSTIIRNSITFTGRVSEFRFWPERDGKKALLKVSIYDRETWTDNQQTRHEGPWENVEVFFRGRRAEKINAMFDKGDFAAKSCVMGTGYIAAMPRLWVGKDGTAGGVIQVDGQTLALDILREEDIRQGAERNAGNAQGGPDQGEPDQGPEPAGWGPDAPEPATAAKTSQPDRTDPSWAAGWNR